MGTLINVVLIVLGGFCGLIFGKIFKIKSILKIF